MKNTYPIFKYLPMCHLKLEALKRCIFKLIQNHYLIANNIYPIHLLHKGNFHCMADIHFDWFGFKQISKSVDNFSINKGT